MSLAESINELSSELRSLSDRKAGADESKLLQARTNELATEGESLVVLLNYVKAFREGSVDMPEVPSAIHLLKTSLRKVRDRFEADSKAANLTKRKDWDTFLNSSEDTRKSLQSGLVKAWQKYVGTCYTGDRPHDIEMVLAKTEENSDVQKKYEIAYDQYQILARQLPTSQIDVSNVKQNADALSELYARFDFNVPESVKAFLDAVGTGGANLNLLTEEVRLWLKSTKSEKRYRIVVGH